MNVRGVSNFNVKAPAFAGIKLGKRLFELLPKITLSDSGRWSHIGTIINRPDVNRGIMGGTALLTQPYIDRHNKRVDKETAEVSACRTFGKILAGTTVGCIVRSGCYYLTQTFTSANPNAPKWKRLLMPSPAVEKIMRRRNIDWLKNYKSVFATLVGIGAMIFTNVFIDVPVTNLITNALLKRREENKTVQSGNGGSK